MTVTVTVDLSKDTRSVTAGAGTAIIEPTRGYLDTIATSHPAGQDFFVYDPLHLSTAGYGDIARDVGAFLQTNTNIFDTSQVTVWGDSLSDSAFPPDLSRLLGVTVHKEAIPGQTSIQIAMREGGTPISITLAGNEIAAGSNFVSAVSGDLLSTSADRIARAVKGSIDGIAGTLNEDGNNNYTFTPDDTHLAATSIAPNSAFVIDNGTLNDGTVIIWAGRNNYQSPAQVESDIANMVAHLGANTHYLVLSVLNSDDANEIAGTADYNTIVALNNDLAASYAGHYLDVREFLVQSGLSSAGITPTKLDRIDIANDAPPSSLHRVLDSGTVGDYIRPGDQSFLLNYLSGTAHAGEVISVGGTERMVVGTTFGDAGYVIADGTGLKGAYSGDNMFHVTTGSGNDKLHGRAGNDVLSAGNGNDILVGEGGADKLTGGGGSDHFVYDAASDSTGIKYDTVIGFNAYSDKFDVPGKITGIDHAIASGRLDTSAFAKDFTHDIGAFQLHAHHALEFTPSSGSFRGYHFLVVDLNGVAGYQAGQDLMIRLDTPANITHLAITDFI